MAIVRKLKLVIPEKFVPHSEVDCTYSIIKDPEGLRYLQIDTYGSSSRREIGMKSQTIRFNPEAIGQLKAILDTEF